MDEPFSYQITKDRRVLISWHGKLVTILKGPEAEKAIETLAGATDEDAQILLARVTGNFRRGNERLAKGRGKSCK